MKHRVTATAQLTVENARILDEWLAEGAKTAEADMARARRQSLLSGMEVTYDITPAGYDWSPVLWHASEQPVAWVHRDGRRSEGSTYPGDDA